jgi:hypothetical protein
MNNFSTRNRFKRGGEGRGGEGRGGKESGSVEVEIKFPQFSSRCPSNRMEWVLTG